MKPKIIPYAMAPWNSVATSPKVTAVRSFLTAPDGIPLLVVKVETDEPGLYGWGCASNPQRTRAIQNVVDQYLGPLLVGRRTGDIDDFHHLAEMNPYWRAGAIENNALAGIDLALWDIKGKLAGMPVHQLLGGQVRTRIPVYGHVAGSSHPEVIDNVLRFQAAGYEYIRCQIAVDGADTYGANSTTLRAQTKTRDIPWLPRSYALTVPRMFAAVREAVGFDLQLLHDVHERLDAITAIRMAKDLDEFRLFFLEDALAPEDSEWYQQMRIQSATPQAVGEVYSNMREFVSLISKHLIDFARIRMCAIGGLTPTIKLAHLCEFFGVKLAIHGPGDVSPIGHAAGIHVDATSRAFGIQESVPPSEAIQEVFPGTPQIVSGHFEIPQVPGLGVEYNERVGARYEAPEPLIWDSWALLRKDDGSVARP